MKTDKNGRKWDLPDFVPFEGIRSKKYPNAVKATNCAFEVIEYRCPKKGEYYLSGAIITGYRAPNDLGIKFLVVKPIKGVHTTMVETPLYEFDIL